MSLSDNENSKDIDPEKANNPYIGPRPYERDDSKLFFGRDQEASELLSLIVSNRVSLLYAQSGAGKTSLINAKLIPLLESEEFDVLPSVRVHGPSVEKIAPSQIQNIYIFNVLLSWSDTENNMEDMVGQSLASFLDKKEKKEDRYGSWMPRVLIFDQFEELFTTYPQRWRDREDFFNQINQLLRADPLIRILFSMRDDYVANIDRYASMLPRNLNSRIHLERMQPSAALQAVMGPVKNTYRQYEPGVAEKLVEELRKVRVELVSGETVSVEGEFIEPVQLQVVCQNLWRDLPKDVQKITLSHLKIYGDVKQALAQFYERAIGQVAVKTRVSETRLRNWFANQLITSAGTRGTVYRGANQTEGVDNNAIQILENLHVLRGEWRAGARWYELTHDTLIEPIQESNQIWVEKRRRKVIMGIGITLITLLFAFLISLILLNNNSEDPNNQNLVVQLTEVVNDQLKTSIASTATSQVTATAIAFERATATSERATATSIFATRQAENLLATEEAIVRATEQVAAQMTATVSAIELATAQAEIEKRGYTRPLRPGISIGAVGSNTIGTLSGFAQDSSGNIYLLSVQNALGSADSVIMQPAPLDGGNLNDDLVAAVPSFEDSLLGQSDSIESLVSAAKLNQNEQFSVIIPEYGPILGVMNPKANEAVMMVGRTSGVKRGVITNIDANFSLGPSGPVLSGGFLIEDELDSSSTFIAPGDEGALIINEQGYALGIVVTTDGNRAVAAPLQDVLQNLNLEFVSQNEYFSLNNEGEAAYVVAVSSDGNTVASGGGNGTVRFWDFSNLDAPPTILTTHDSAIRGLAFSPVGSAFVSSDNNSEIRLWDLSQENDRPSVRTDHGDAVRSVAFTPNGRFLASTSWDNSIGFWEVDNPNSLTFLRFMPVFDSGRIWAGMFIPTNGNQYATVHNDGSIYLWDVTNPNFPTQLDIALQAHRAPAVAVAYSPDGQLLASASTDRTVQIRPVTNLSRFNSVPEIELPHPDFVWAVAFSPDGRFLASGSADGGVRLWDTASLSGEPINTFFHDERVWSIAFSPDGRFLFSASDDGTIRIWQISW